MLGSIAEAARLVAPRDIKIVHAVTGTETAIPAVSGAAAIAADVFESAGGGLEGEARGRASGGTGGGVRGTGEGGMAVTSREQVPLFRCKGNKACFYDGSYLVPGVDEFVSWLCPCTLKRWGSTVAR